ncbi:MAG: hypothetical protein B6D59_04785 [Campylobacteraceae bacterium 4484_4]|nr:MAG: hypothetical protein B6D59_04785 [Campylobacteraceae bacterium 4484_4]
MIKYIFTVALLLVTIQASEDIAMTTNDIRAYPLNETRGYIHATYDRVNDTLDLFNVRASQLGNAQNYGAIGDAVGYALSLGYGLRPYLSLHYNFEQLHINYIEEKLKNRQHELYLKLNLYYNPTAFIESYAVDFGFVRNSAADLAIRRESTLNSMLRKIRPDGNFRLENDVFYYGENLSLSFGDTPPYLLIENMADYGYFIRLIGGTRIKRSILNMYAGIRTTSIDSDIVLRPYNSIVQAAIDEFGDLNLGRHEKSLFGGFSWTIEWQKFLFDLGYEYIRLFDRGEGLGENNDNHIIKAAIGYPVNDRMLLYIGGKLMLHQFNGVIPYLYNKYTQSKYDKKYGYARFGVVYNFDADSWLVPEGYSSY